MNRNLFKITTMLLISMLSIVGCDVELKHQEDGIYHHDENTHWMGCGVADCFEKFNEEQHDWSDWSTIKEATCREYGEEERQCNTCNRKEKRSIAKLNHSSVTLSKDDTGHWNVCSVCGVIVNNSKVEHTYKTWTTIKEATPSEEGLEKGTCECGYETERVIPKIVIPTESIEVNLPSCVSNNSVLLSQASFDMTYTVTPSNATDYSEVEVTSSNNQVATINEGKVTLLKEGYTEIKVSNGVKETIQPLFVTSLLIDGQVTDQAYEMAASDVATTYGAGYETTNNSSVVLTDNGLYIHHYVTDKYISSLSHIEAALCFGQECSEDNTLFMNIYPDTSAYEQVRFFAEAKAYNDAKEITDIKYVSASNIKKEETNTLGYEVEVFIPYDQLSDFGCSSDITSVKYIPLVYQYKNQNDADRASLKKSDDGLDKHIAYGEIDTLKAKYLTYLMPTFNKNGSVSSTNIRPIVEYTFDNGQIVNTGSNQSINGRITTMVDNTITEVTNPTSTFETDASGKENSAICLTNNKEGEHFTISGVNLETNDFTISVKFNIKNLTTYENSENYLFGIGTTKDAPEGYFGVNYKYHPTRKITQVRFRINGESKWVGYVPVGEFVEIRITRKGDTVFFAFNNDALHGDLIVHEYQLNSTTSLKLSNYDIGFSSNVGCSDPGDWPIVYDDIKIYDYAIPM